MRHIVFAVSKALAASLLLAASSSALSDIKVVELFTSQSCYSCPAADKLIGEIGQQQPDVLTLELHVDYWNLLQYRSAGSWEDPYSSSEYTNRQRIYNGQELAALDNNHGVYTPQAVINGRYSVLGSDASAVYKGLKHAEPLPLSVDIIKHDKALDISIDGQGDREAGVYLVRYLKETTTNITGGENKSLIMKNYNVVIHMRSLGKVSDNNGQFKVAYEQAPNEGCAILVQPASQGAMIGAARCHGG